MSVYYNPISLFEQIGIAEMVKKQKVSASFASESPIGSSINGFLESEGIILLEYPIARAEPNSFSAMYLCTEANGTDFHFIAVNTWDYYDKQLFAIAHELYHYAQRGISHICREGVSQSQEERCAEYYAAEFLLPLGALRNTIVKEFGRIDISDANITQLFRFVARLQCTWWLPYKAIIKRLLEAGAISKDIFVSLYEIDERNTEGQYYRIGMSTNEQSFSLLNKITKKNGTSAKNLENTIRNFEEGIISEGELIKGLELFGARPEDYGIEFALDESVGNWDEFFAEGRDDES